MPAIRRPMHRGRIHGLIAQSSVALATLLSAGVAGCDGNNSIPIDELSARVDERVCAFATACGTVPDQASCNAVTSFATDAQLATLVAAVKRGTIAYDGALADQCLSEFGTGCTVSFGQSPACRDTFHGLVAPGGVCVLSEECSGNGTCLQAGCVSACCPGVCSAGTTPIPIGGNCATLPGQCVSDAYCNGGVCAAKLAAGMACTGADACQSPGNCVLGSPGSGIRTGVCTLPGDTGAACRSGDASPLCLRITDYCDTVTNVCVKRKAPGGSCATSDLECVPYARCVDGICKSRPIAGEACDPSLATGCLGNLRCTAGVCAVAPATGVVCTP